MIGRRPIFPDPARRTLAGENVLESIPEGKEHPMWQTQLLD